MWRFLLLASDYYITSFTITSVNYLSSQTPLLLVILNPVVLLKHPTTKQNNNKHGYRKTCATSQRLARAPKYGPAGRVSRPREGKPAPLSLHPHG